MKKFFLFLAVFLGACTGSPLTTQAALDSDVSQGVQLAAAGVMSNDPHTIQWFITASEGLNDLTANGTPTLAQIDEEIANKIPVQYQGVVKTAASIAVQKYQTWYTANQATLTASSNAQYVLGVIQAARDGINTAIANLPPAVLASAPGVTVSSSGVISLSVSSGTLPPAAPASTVPPVGPVPTPSTSTSN